MRPRLGGLERIGDRPARRRFGGKQSSRTPGGGNSKSRKQNGRVSRGRGQLVLECDADHVSFGHDQRGPWNLHRVAEPVEWLETRLRGNIAAVAPGINLRAVRL